MRTADTSALRRQLDDVKEAESRREAQLLPLVDYLIEVLPESFSLVTGQKNLTGGPHRKNGRTWQIDSGLEVVFGSVRRDSDGFTEHASTERVQQIRKDGRPFSPRLLDALEQDLPLLLEKAQELVSERERKAHTGIEVGEQLALAQRILMLDPEVQKALLAGVEAQEDQALSSASTPAVAQVPTPIPVDRNGPDWKQRYAAGSRNSPEGMGSVGD